MGRVASSVLVGRANELANLGDCLALTRDGRAPLVVVSGEAGVGKTRCVEAFLEFAGRDGVQVLSGGCPPSSAGVLPYAPIAEALRGLTRTARPDLLARRLAGRSAALRVLVPDLDHVLPDR